MNAIDLKRKRERLGWSQAELGKTIEVSRHTVLNWETEKIQIPKTAQIALNNVFADQGV
jgi:DNA-binding XRE family transcriptional regulator